MRCPKCSSPGYVVGVACPNCDYLYGETLPKSSSGKHLSVQECEEALGLYVEITLRATARKLTEDDLETLRGLAHRYSSSMPEEFTTAKGANDYGYIKGLVLGAIDAALTAQTLSKSRFHEKLQAAKGGSESS
jgi:hypothetical protein